MKRNDLKMEQTSIDIREELGYVDRYDLIYFWEEAVNVRHFRKLLRDYIESAMILNNDEDEL